MFSIGADKPAAARETSPKPHSEDLQPNPPDDNHRKAGSSRIQTGVTLIELVVTLSIAAILLTIGVPSFQDLMRNNRSAAQVNEFLTALNLARSEAVKRGASVSVCSSTDSATCRTSSVTNWADGWILYVTGTSPLEVLRVWPAMSGTATCTATAGEVTFRGTGQATAAITFTYNQQDAPAINSELSPSLRLAGRLQARRRAPDG